MQESHLGHKIKWDKSKVKSFIDENGSGSKAGFKQYLSSVRIPLL